MKPDVHRIWRSRLDAPRHHALGHPRSILVAQRVRRAGGRRAGRRCRCRRMWRRCHRLRRRRRWGGRATDFRGAPRRGRSAERSFRAVVSGTDAPFSRRISGFRAPSSRRPASSALDGFRKFVGVVVGAPREVALRFRCTLSMLLFVTATIRGAFFCVGHRRCLFLSSPFVRPPMPVRVLRAFARALPPISLRHRTTYIWTTASRRIDDVHVEQECGGSKLRVRGRARRETNCQSHVFVDVASCLMVSAIAFLTKSMIHRRHMTSANP